MNRRTFLKTLGSVARGEIASIPTKIAKIPKNTVANVKQYDSAVRGIKKNGSQVMSRRAVLVGGGRRVGKAIIRNPKEASYRLKQTSRVLKQAALRSITPLDQVVLQSEGRRLSKWQGLLSNFSHYRQDRRGRIID